MMLPLKPAIESHFRFVFLSLTPDSKSGVGTHSCTSLGQVSMKKKEVPLLTLMMGVPKTRKGMDCCTTNKKRVYHRGRKEQSIAENKNRMHSVCCARNIERL